MEEAEKGVDASETTRRKQGVTLEDKPHAAFKEKSRPSTPANHQTDSQGLCTPDLRIGKRVMDE